jgi:hypothetical protein
MESMLYGEQRFLDGREIMEDESRSGRPCTSKTEENMTSVRTVVKSD